MEITGSIIGIKISEPIYKIVKNPWLPSWAYSEQELKDIKSTAASYGINGYTTKELIETTHYYS